MMPITTVYTRITVYHCQIIADLFLPMLWLLIMRVTTERWPGCAESRMGWNVAMVISEILLREARTGLITGGRGRGILFGERERSNTPGGPDIYTLVSVSGSSQWDVWIIKSDQWEALILKADQSEVSQIFNPCARWLVSSYEHQADEI